ncbi:MAG: accessory factor UbiK family protein [Rhodanobacteraceae bacterium]|jgi:BMFP domain-containing protein YqiC|nr:accessory factor UbiK family protein [Rhodanobacteraceae bacterium]
MINVQAIDELAQKLAALVPPGLDDARKDLTATFRSALQSGLRGLDLVTREEFDVQRCVLLRTREKIEQLEQQLQALERTLGASAEAPPRH